jgi:hypothetical protein
MTHNRRRMALLENAYVPSKSGSGKMWITRPYSGIPTLRQDGGIAHGVNLPMQWESGRQRCLKIDLFAGDGVVEFQILGVQEISSIAGEAGEILKRLAG